MSTTEDVESFDYEVPTVVWTDRGRCTPRAAEQTAVDWWIEHASPEAQHDLLGELRAELSNADVY